MWYYFADMNTRLNFALLFALTVILVCVTGIGVAKNMSQSNAHEPKKAYFAAGCFWKVQHVFAGVPGVVRTEVGYMNGKTANPTYEQVCSHTTGHAEAVMVEYDPAKVSYEQLLQVFFTNHDPTTMNRQGPDIGDQYRSAIFYVDDQQKAAAEAYKQKLTVEHGFKKPVVTEISQADQFFRAEDYHQDYYKKHGAVCY
jgi:peptide-methionine (S)-S-oxide reductase